MGQPSLLFARIIVAVIFSAVIVCAQDFVRVERAIDGDTIVLEGGERVRLIGVNTPDTVHPKKAVERFGKEASAFTKRMVEGKWCAWSSILSLVAGSEGSIQS